MAWAEAHADGVWIAHHVREQAQTRRRDVGHGVLEDAPPAFLAHRLGQRVEPAVKLAHGRVVEHRLPGLALGSEVEVGADVVAHPRPPQPFRFS